MPEFCLHTASGAEIVVSTVTVGMYRRYCELMERAEGLDARADAVVIGFEIVRAVFVGQVSYRDIVGAEAEEVLTVLKAVHFTMQEIVTPKFLELMPDRDRQAVEEQEKSAFDEYDEAEGYEEDPPQSMWRILRENTDRVVKLAIRALHNSLSQCMESDIMSLLDYVRFEIETANENT